jgi:hypothetical protein
MEKVKVVKAIPGILNVGDILISPIPGADFNLAETEVTKDGSSERYVSLDYVTVSENISEFFVPEVEIPEELIELDVEECCGKCYRNLFINRPLIEIDNRYDFFVDKAAHAIPGSEEHVVYQNLIWLIDWLRGDTELIG